MDKNKKNIESVFDKISGKYDFLNHFLSLGIDRVWRKKALRELSKRVNLTDNLSVLDVAAGTGDLSILMSKKTNWKITGIDLSQKMLDVAKRKAKKDNLTDNLDFQQMDALNSTFESSSFDIVTVSFGVRNFEDLNLGLKEFNRLLKNGGILTIVEFSWSNSFILKAFLSVFIPVIGLVFGDFKSYKYLAVSGNSFPAGDKMLKIMEECGFVNLNYLKMTFGIATVYVGTRI